MRKELKEIEEQFMSGIDCAAVVAESCSAELGVEPETIRRMAAGFGGGMQCGETCGAVTGAYMALGLRYGNGSAAEAERKAVLLERMGRFQEKFKEHHDSLLCRDLLGYDVSKPGQLEEAVSSGRMMSFCPKLVQEVTEILEELRAEQ